MFGTRRRVSVCAWVLMAMAGAAPALGQVGAGALAGDVTDQAGAAVPGATVTVVAVDTNLSRTTVTSGHGAYVVPGLAPGVYRVRVELSGFRPAGP